MNAGPWKSRADFETWWLANVRALNRLSVTDYEEWLRVSAAVETFQRENPKVANGR